MGGHRTKYGHPIVHAGPGEPRSSSTSSWASRTSSSATDMSSVTPYASSVSSKTSRSSASNWRDPSTTIGATERVGSRGQVVVVNHGTRREDSPEAPSPGYGHY